jgi:hypothetical protein
MTRIKFSVYAILLILGLTLIVRVVHAVTCPPNCNQSQVSCASAGRTCPSCAGSVCAVITICCTITSFSADFPSCGTCTYPSSCDREPGEYTTISWTGTSNGTSCSNHNYFCCNPCSLE